MKFYLKRWYLVCVSLTLILNIGLAQDDFTLEGVCLNAGIQEDLTSGLVDDAVYSGTGVTDNGDNTTFNFDPSVTGVGTHVIMFGNASGTIEVFAVPEPVLEVQEVLPCGNIAGGGMPTGGVYSGTGVTDGGDGETLTIDPDAAMGTEVMIMYSVTDDNGCSATTMAIFTLLEDTEAPEITDCSTDDIIVNAASGECEAAVTWTPPVAAMDNCDGDVSANIVRTDATGIEPGDVVDIGNYLITYQVTDAAGNTGTCEFNITVVGVTPENTQLACAGQINLSLGVDCNVALTAGLFLTGGPYGCFADGYAVQIEGADGKLSKNIANLRIDKSRYVGTHRYRVTDLMSGNYCWGEVIIEDASEPQFSFPRQPRRPRAMTQFKCYEDLSGLSTLEDFGLRPPAVNDNCLESSDFNWTLTSTEDVSEDYDLSDFARGQCFAVYMNTWTTSYTTKSGETKEVSFDYPYLVRPANGRDFTSPGQHPDGIDLFDGTGVIEIDDCLGSLAPEDIAAVKGPLYAYPYLFNERFIDIEVVKDKIRLRDEYIEDFESLDFLYSNYGEYITLLKPEEDAVCNLFVRYEDVEFEVCEEGCVGNKKIVRSWYVLDWCLGEQFGPYTQIIKVIDDIAPTFEARDEVYSTDPWDCTATFTLPGVWELEDNCDENPRVRVEGPAGVDITQSPDGKATVTGAPKGIHPFTYIATDCCGNERRVDFTVVVKDDVAPIVSTIQNVVVGISQDGSDLDGNGKLYWHQVDNKSYDACTDVKVEIRRPNNAPSCRNLGDLLPPGFTKSYNNNNTFNNDGHTNDSSYDTDGGEFVKFCCEDVTAETVDVNGDGVLDAGYHKVIVRVWDNADMSVDGDGNPTYGTEGDNFNEAWTYVKVEDNTPPIIQCPDDATVYCDWDIDNKIQGSINSRATVSSLTGWTGVEYFDFGSIDTAYAYSTCGLEIVEFVDVLILDEDDGLNDCGVGQFTRIWRVTKPLKNGTPFISYCYQKISILGRDLTSIGFGFDDTPVATDCNGPSEQDLFDHQPQLSGENNSCYTFGIATTVDTFLFEEGACKKWRVKYSVSEWCSGYGPEDLEALYGVGYFYKDFMYFDEEAPVIEECDGQMYETDADCETNLTLTNVATDTGGCIAGGWLKWQVFVNLDNDKTTDVYVTDNYNYEWYQAAAADRDGEKVSYGIYDGNSWTGWVVFTPTNGTFYDDLPAGVEWAEKVYVKVGTPTTSGETKEVTLDLAELTIYGNMSTHHVAWKVADGCHNDDSCGYEFMVADKKAPTPYCVSLSTAVMEGSDMVELWARDFDKGSFDNCTAQEDLLFTFNGNNPVLDKIDQVHYFKGAGEDATAAEYLTGQAQKWLPSSKSSALLFDCDDVGADRPINMSVWDEKLNTDFCEVLLTITDTDGSCGQTDNFTVGGSVKTSSGITVENVDVTLKSEISDSDRNASTDSNGSYAFSNVKGGLKYDVQASNNSASILADGAVNTLDMVLIQQHILKLRDLSDSYSVIAADINNDGKIKSNDLLALRRVILEVSDVFPNNTSWRYVDASQSFTDAMNPFPANEVMTAELTGNKTDIDFVAVKVGDVDGDVDGLLSGATAPRSNKTITLSTTDRAVVAGEEVVVSFTSEDFADVYGYQFAVNAKGLAYAGVESTTLNIGDDNIAMIDGTMKVSYGEATAVSGSEVMTVKFVATEAGMLSDMIGLNRGSMTAEAYVGADLERVNVEIAVRGEVEADYALYTNEPNPFRTATVIGYTMPKAGAATLQVTDVTGKVVLVRNLEGVAGYNETTIQRSELGGSGVMYYTLSSGEFTATKKMIIIE